MNRTLIPSVPFPFSALIDISSDRSTSPTVYKISMGTSKQSCDSKAPELCRSMRRTFIHSHRIYWDDILAVKEPKGGRRGETRARLVDATPRDGASCEDKIFTHLPFAGAAAWDTLSMVYEKQANYSTSLIS